MITGAACSGKTTLIELLADKGYKTVAETGRQYIQTEVAKGRTLDEIFESEADERGMKDLQLVTESRTQAIEVTFFDRALPDSLTYYRTAGLNPNEILTECFQHRYASVFLLDLLPFHEDGVRNEDYVFVHFIDKWLECDYQSLGYQTIRVPVLSPQAQFQFIFERLFEKGLL